MASALWSLAGRLRCEGSRSWRSPASSHLWRIWYLLQSRADRSTRTVLTGVCSTVPNSKNLLTFDGVQDGPSIAVATEEVHLLRSRIYLRAVTNTSRTHTT